MPFRHKVQDNELIILNDATITIEEGHEKSLQEDLSRYASSGGHVVASLNRGAIIEDLYRSGVGEKLWTRDLLHLLLEDGSKPDVLPEDLEKVELEEHGFADSCVAYSMEVEGQKIEFAVAFLDKHSLLEAIGGPFDLDNAGALKRLETPAGKATSLGQDHAVATPLRNLNLSGDRVGAVLCIDEGVLSHVHPRIQRERCAVAHEIRPAGNGGIETLERSIV